MIDSRYDIWGYDAMGTQFVLSGIPSVIEDTIWIHNNYSLWEDHNCPNSSIWEQCGLIFVFLKHMPELAKEKSGTKFSILI